MGPLLILLGRYAEYLLKNLGKIVGITDAHLIANLSYGNGFFAQKLGSTIHTQRLDIVSWCLPGQCLYFFEEDRTAIAHGLGHVVDGKHRVANVIVEPCIHGIEQFAVTFLDDDLGRCSCRLCVLAFGSLTAHQVTLLYQLATGANEQLRVERLGQIGISPCLGSFQALVIIPRVHDSFSTSLSEKRAKVNK